MGNKPKVSCGPGLTQAQFKKECDINAIMKRYRSTGIPPALRKGGVYGDFSNVGDYREALEKVENAREDFGSLPAEIRSRFRNDPGELIAFLSNTANRDEAVKLGLVEPKVAEDKKDKDVPASAPAKNA